MRFKGVELDAVGVLASGTGAAEAGTGAVEVVSVPLSKGDEEAGTKGDAATRNNEPRAGADEVAGTGATEAGTGAGEESTRTGVGAGEKRMSASVAAIADTVLVAMSALSASMSACHVLQNTATNEQHNPACSRPCTKP